MLREKKNLLQCLGETAEEIALKSGYYGVGNFTLPLANSKIFQSAVGVSWPFYDSGDSSGTVITGP